EHRAGALTVVGEHDQTVRSRRVGGRLLDDPDDLVEARDGVARFHTIRPGVVRDLVVIDEVHVDRGGTTQHLLDDERRAEMAEEDVRRRSRERIGKAARPAELGPGRPRLDKLFEDLADREQRPPYVAVRTDEEPVEDVTAADLPRRIVERRRCEEAPRRIAGEEIADRSAAVREETVAVRYPPH